MKKQAARGKTTKSNTKKSQKSETAKTKSKLSFKFSNNIIYGLVVTGVLLMLVTGWVWYSKVYQSPERVFWGMVGNNLSTRGITREVNQDNNGTKSLEVAKISFGDTPGVQLHKELSQFSETGEVVIHVEGVGTPTDDYQRYSFIKRPDASGKALDYSQLYKSWVHSVSAKDGQNPQLLPQTLLGTTLFGDLGSSKRGELVNYIRDHDVYTTNFNKVKHTEINGRSVIVYDVSIKTRALAAALKQYGTALGLKSVAGIDPNSYSDKPFQVNMAIDPHSRQLVNVSYQSSNITENYSSYGVSTQVKAPSPVVDIKTFTNLLNQIEGTK